MAVVVGSDMGYDILQRGVLNVYKVTVFGLLAQTVVDINGKFWEKPEEILSMVSYFIGDPEREQEQNGFLKLYQGVKHPGCPSSSLAEKKPFQKLSDNTSYKSLSCNFSRPSLSSSLQCFH